MWIDSHCHLNHERFEGKQPLDIANEALEQGVDGMVTINCRIHDEFPQILKNRSRTRKYLVFHWDAST